MSISRKRAGAGALRMLHATQIRWGFCSVYPRKSTGNSLGKNFAHGCATTAKGRNKKKVKVSKDTFPCPGVRARYDVGVWRRTACRSPFPASRLPRPASLCVVRYKNKIKSITWQTTPHLCGNLLFLDCVCSRSRSRSRRQRESQHSRCKVKCFIFPFGGEFDPFLKTHTVRALLALCLNSQLSCLNPPSHCPSLPFALPPPLQSCNL